MLDPSTDHLAAVFGALVDPTRRAILTRLTRGNSSVSTLSEPFQISQPAISKHLRVLENAGLIERWKSGRVHYCRLIAEPLRGAAEWIERYREYWEQQFDSLAHYLDQEATECKDRSASAPASPSARNAGSRRRPRGSSKPGRIPKS